MIWLLAYFCSVACYYLTGNILDFDMLAMAYNSAVYNINPNAHKRKNIYIYFYLAMCNHLNVQDTSQMVKWLKKYFKKHSLIVVTEEFTVFVARGLRD